MNEDTRTQEPRGGAQAIEVQSVAHVRTVAEVQSVVGEELARIR